MPFRNLSTHAPTIDLVGICDECGIAVRPGEKHSYVEVVGWQQVGTSRLVDRQATGRVRCAACRDGGGTQGALW